LTQPKKKRPRRKPVAQQPANNPDQEKYNLFVNALKKRGIPVNSGYRSRQQQANLYNRLPKGEAARPGTSDHEFWRAVDTPPDADENLIREAAKEAGIELGPHRIHQGTGRHRHQSFNKPKQQEGEFTKLLKQLPQEPQDGEFTQLLKGLGGPTDRSEVQDTGNDRPWVPKMYTIHDVPGAPQGQQTTQKQVPVGTSEPQEPAAGVAAVDPTAAQDPGSRAFSKKVTFRDKPEGVSNTEWAIQQLIPEIVNRTGHSQGDVERQLRKGIAHYEGTPLDEISPESYYEFAGSEDFVNALDQQRDAREAALEAALESPEEWSPADWDRFSKETGTDPAEIQAALSGQSERFSSFAEAGNQRRQALAAKTQELMQQGGLTQFQAGVRARVEMGILDELKAQELLQKDQKAQQEFEAYFRENFIDTRAVTAGLGQVSSMGGGMNPVQDSQTFAKLQDPVEYEKARSEYVAMQMQNMLQQYGSYDAAMQRHKNVMRDYDPNLRPLARPLEMAKSLVKALPEAVSSIFRTGAFLQDFITPGMVYRAVTDTPSTPTKDKNLVKLAEWVEKHTEENLGQNKDLQVEFMNSLALNLAFNVGPNAVGQLLTQVGAGALGGGAKLATLIGMGQGLGEQQKEAIKGGASENQIKLHSLIGAVAAVPDIIPLAKWMHEPTLLNKFFGKFFAGAVEQVGEEAALQATKGLIARTLSRAKTFAAGSAMEGLQELSEKKINDAVATMTYDPKRRVLVFTDEDLLETLGGAVGGLGGAAVEITMEGEQPTTANPTVDQVLAQYNQTAPAQTTAKTPDPMAIAPPPPPAAVEPVEQPVGVQVGSTVEAPFRGKTVTGTVTNIENGKLTVQTENNTFVVNEKRATPVTQQTAPPAAAPPVEPDAVPKSVVPVQAGIKVAPYDGPQAAPEETATPSVKSVERRGVRERVADFIYPEGKNRRETAERAAQTDDLTGLANRGALDRALPAAEKDPNTSVIAFDANNFGQINKKVSQQAGDQALKDIASAIQQAAKEEGVGERVFRRGGDEFVVLAPKAKAERVRKLAEQIYGDKDYSGVKVSISGTVGNTFNEADATLQDAKAVKKGLKSAPKGSLKRTFKGPVEQQSYYANREFLKKELDKVGLEADPAVIEATTEALFKKWPDPKTFRKAITDFIRDETNDHVTDRVELLDLQGKLKRKKLSPDDQTKVHYIKKKLQEYTSGKMLRLREEFDLDAIAEDILFRMARADFGAAKGDPNTGYVMSDWTGEEVGIGDIVKYRVDKRQGTVERIVDEYGETEAVVRLTHDSQGREILPQNQHNVSWPERDIRLVTRNPEVTGQPDLARTFDIYLNKYKGLFDKQDVKVEEFTKLFERGIIAPARQLAAPLTYRPPYTVSSLLQPQFDDFRAKNKLVSKETITSMAFKNAKPLEKEFINTVLASPIFKDRKKFPFNEFELELSRELLPLNVIYSAHHANYGVSRLGAYDSYGKEETHIYDVPAVNATLDAMDHGYTAHWTDQYDEMVDRAQYKVDQVVSPSGEPVYLVVPDIVYDIDYPSTGYALEQEYPRWVRKKGKGDKGDFKLNEESLYEVSVFNTRNREDAELVAKDLTQRVKRTKGLFGHTRVWYKDDTAYIAEIQGEGLQRFTYPYHGGTKSTWTTKKWHWGASQWDVSRSVSSAVEMVFNHFQKRHAVKGTVDEKMDEFIDFVMEGKMTMDALSDISDATTAIKKGGELMDRIANDILSEIENRVDTDPEYRDDKGNTKLTPDDRMKVMSKELAKMSDQLQIGKLRRQAIETKLEELKEYAEEVDQKEKVAYGLINSEEYTQAIDELVHHIRLAADLRRDDWKLAVDRFKQDMEDNLWEEWKTEADARTWIHDRHQTGDNQFYLIRSYKDPQTKEISYVPMSEVNYYEYSTNDLHGLWDDASSKVETLAQEIIEETFEDQVKFGSDFFYMLKNPMVAHFRGGRWVEHAMNDDWSFIDNAQIRSEIQEAARDHFSTKTNRMKSSDKLRAEYEDLKMSYSSEDFKNFEDLERDLIKKWKSFTDIVPLWAKQFIYHQKNFGPRMAREEIQRAAKRGLKTVRMAAPETGALIEGHVDTTQISDARKVVDPNLGYSVYTQYRSDRLDAGDIIYLDGSQEPYMVVEVGEGWLKAAKGTSVIMGTPDKVIMNLTAEAPDRTRDIEAQARELLEEFGYRIFPASSRSGSILAAYEGPGFDIVELKMPDTGDPKKIDLKKLRAGIRTHHQPIFDRYVEMADWTFKERPDARWVTDHNGHRWIEFDITEADVNKPIALFRADLLEDHIDQRDKWAQREEMDDEFFRAIDSQIDDSGAVRLNFAAAELIRRIETQTQIDQGDDPFVPLFAAAMGRQQDVDNWIDRLATIDSELTRLGYPDDSRKGIQELRKQLESLPNRVGVIYTRNFALPHEKIHEARYLNAAMEASVRSYYDDFEATFNAAKTDRGNMTVNEKAFRNYFSKTYYNNRKFSSLDREERGILHEEVFTAITDGDYAKLKLTDSEAARFIEADLDAYVKKNGDQILDDIEVWANEKVKKFAAVEKLLAGKQATKELKKAGISVQETESRNGERDRGGAQDAGTQEADGRGVKDRRLPKTVGRNTSLVEDDLTSVARQLEQLPRDVAAKGAEEWLESQGFESAYSQVFDLPPSGQNTAKRMAVIEHIDAQVERYTQQGDTGRAKEWYSRLVTLTNAISPDYTEYGRAIGQLARWADLDPQAVVGHTQQKMAKAGKADKLTLEQQQQLRDQAKQIAELEKKVQDLEAKKNGAGGKGKSHPLNQQKLRATAALQALKSKLGSLKRYNQSLKAAADKIRKLGAQGTAASWINRNENNVTNWQELFNDPNGLDKLREQVDHSHTIASNNAKIKELSITDMNGYLDQQVALADDGANLANPQIQRAVQLARTNRKAAVDSLVNWVMNERQQSLQEWDKYLTNDNDVYAEDPFFRDFVWQGLTESLRNDRPDIPPSLDRAVLAGVYETFSQGNNFTGFMKLYKKESSRALAEAKDMTKVTTSGGQWVKIPRTSQDSPDFEQNANRLRSLSAQSWCTSRGMERPYIQKGDFWIYQEGGVTELAIRFDGDQVVEIQGRLNNGRIPVEYIQQVTELQNSGEVQFSKGAQTQIDRAKRQVVETQKIEKWLEDENIKVGSVSTEVSNAETLEHAKMAYVGENMPRRLASIIYDRYEGIADLEWHVDRERDMYIAGGRLTEDDIENVTDKYQYVIAQLAWEEMTAHHDDEQDYDDERNPGDLVDPNWRLNNFLEDTEFKHFDDLYDTFFPGKFKAPAPKPITKEQLSEVKNAESLGQAQAIYEYHTNLNQFIADNKEYISKRQLDGVTNPSISEAYRKRNFDQLTRTVGIRKTFESAPLWQQEEMLGLRKLKNGNYVFPHRVSIGADGTIGNPYMYRPTLGLQGNIPTYGLPIGKFLDKIEVFESSVQLRKGVKVPKLRLAEKNLVIEARGVEVPKLQVVGGNLYIQRTATKDIKFPNLVAVGRSIGVLNIYNYATEGLKAPDVLKFPKLIREGSRGLNQPGMVMSWKPEKETSSSGHTFTQMVEHNHDLKGNKLDSSNTTQLGHKKFDARTFASNLRLRKGQKGYSLKSAFDDTKHGPGPRGPKRGFLVDEDQVRKVYREYLDGKSLRQAAKENGVSHELLRRRFKELGLDLKTKGEGAEDMWRDGRGKGSLKNAFGDIEGDDDFLSYEGDVESRVTEYIDRFEPKNSLEREIFRRYIKDVVNPDEEILEILNPPDRIMLAEFLGERYATEWAEEWQDVYEKSPTEEQVKDVEDRMFKLAKEAAERYDAEDPLPAAANQEIDNDPARPLEDRLNDMAMNAYWDNITKSDPMAEQEDDDNDSWPDLLMRVDEDRPISDFPKDTRDALVDVAKYKYLEGRMADGLSFDDWRSAVMNELVAAKVDPAQLEGYYKSLYREVVSQVKQERFRAELDRMKEKYNLQDDTAARLALIEEKDERVKKLKLHRDAEKAVRPERDKRTALQVAIDNHIEAGGTKLTRDDVLGVKDRNRFFSQRAGKMKPSEINDLYLEAVNLYIDATSDIREAQQQRRAEATLKAPGYQPALDKEEVKQINKELDEARRLKTKESHNLRKLIEHIVGRPLTKRERLGDWYMRLNRNGEALLTATVKTAAHNVIAQRGTKVINALETAVELAFAKAEQTLGVSIFSETGLDIPASTRLRDVLKEEVKSSTFPSVRKALQEYRDGEADLISALQTVAAYKQRVVEGVLGHNPDLYDQMIGAFSYGQEQAEARPIDESYGMGAKTVERFVRGVERYTHYGTVLNRIQEKHYRFATFLATLTADLKGMGVDLDAVVEEGQTANIPRNLLERATKRALEDTFGEDLPSDSSLAQFIKAGHNSAAWIPFMLNPMLFRRFFYNSGKFMVEHTPLVLAKTVTAKGFSRRDAAKFVMGTSMFLFALQVLREFGSDDDDPTVLNIHGHNLRISAFNPISTFIVMANFYRRYEKGKTPMKTGDELFQLLGIDTRYPNLALDWWKSIINLGSGDEAKYVKLSEQSTILGARGLSAFLRPLATVKDIISQFDEMESAVRDPMGQTFRTELGKTVPLVSTREAPLLGPPPPVREDVMTGKPMTKKSPLLDQMGFTFINDNQVGAKFSPAEEYLDQAAAQERSLRPKKFKDPEERRRSGYTAQLFTAIDKGNDVSKVAVDYKKRGLITKDQLDDLLDANRIKSTVERKAKVASIGKIVDAWYLANEDERKILRKVLTQKVANQKKRGSLKPEEERVAREILTTP
jgi:diguanylate cyclase (GGDEF)-like protein